jgi:hypothetical protein
MPTGTLYATLLGAMSEFDLGLSALLTRARGMEGRLF